MVKADEDLASLRAIEGDAAKLRETVEQLEFRRMFSNPADPSNCFLDIQAGAGGTEACDWAEMLLRMYLRYYERSEYTVEELARTDGEEAGIRSITLKVSGPYAMGYMSCERGVHRLVRISPFDSNKRRHTSFAAVDVLPVLEDIDVELKEPELDIVFFRRAAGAGGQNVNKVSTAVRIKHIPTGITVECVNERSQQQNKRMAMAILQSK